MADLIIAPHIILPEAEIECQPIRAQGAGGQNVNKVSSAIHLRLDINSSSLPSWCKQRLLELKDRRISTDGVLVIKAQRFRTQAQNRQDARLRLQALIASTLIAHKPRIATKPTRASQQRRLEHKTREGQRKRMRAKIL